MTRCCVVTPPRNSPMYIYVYRYIHVYMYMYTGRKIYMRKYVNIDMYIHVFMKRHIIYMISFWVATLPGDSPIYIRVYMYISRIGLLWSKWRSCQLTRGRLRCGTRLNIHVYTSLCVYTYTFIGRYISYISWGFAWRRRYGIPVYMRVDICILVR